MINLQKNLATDPRKSLKKKNSEAAQPDSFLNTCSIILLILKEIVSNLKNDKSSNKNLATDPEFCLNSKTAQPCRILK
jgi:hypothetical protein